MDDIRKKIAGAENVIMESNSVMRFLKPDVYLSVLDAGTEDFKESAREFLPQADGIILHRNGSSPKWDSVPLDLTELRPVFLVEPPQYVTPEIVEFVRERISAAVHR